MPTQPTNTLQEELEQTLIQYFADLFDARDKAADAAWADKSTKEAADAIIAAFQARLPKKAKETWSCRTCGEHPQNRGDWCAKGCGSDYSEMKLITKTFNQCLDAVNEVLGDKDGIET